MPSEEDVLARYTWATGQCFRCARRDVDTTKVGEITAQSREVVPVRACGGCVLDLEAERRRVSERKGIAYRPGHVGEVVDAGPHGRSVES